MTQELSPGNPAPFESIRRVYAAGNESWSSREFAKVLGYSDYRKIETKQKRLGKRFDKNDEN